MIEVELPDGRVVEVDTTDPQVAAQAAQKFMAAPKQAEAPSMAADVAKSGGIGLAQGAIGMAGMLPDIAGMLKGAANKYLIDPVLDATIGLPESGPAQTTDINKMFGSENIKKQIEGVTGDFYKPQTTAGEYARTVGEFAPNLAFGPGGLARKALTNVAAPALASETAGQLTEGTALEPFARIAGGVAGGVAGAKAGAAQAGRGARAAIPSTDDLLTAGGRQFEQVRTSGAAVDSNDVQIIAQGIRSKLLQDGADPDAQKLVFNVLDRLEAKGLAGQPVPYGEIDVLRKNLNSLRLNPDGSVRKFAKDATTELMDLMTQVLPQNVSGTLKDAIGNWAAGKRSNVIQGKANLADLNAATAGAGGNIDNSSRQAMKQLARPLPNDVVPVAKKLGFNDAEIAKINEAARGTTGGNAARFVGKLAPTGVVSGGISGGAGFALSGGNPLGAAALPAVGYLAKAIGDLSTQRAIKALDSLVRSRSPLAAQVAASLPQIAAQLPPKSAALLNSFTSLQSAQPSLNVNQPAY